MKFSNKFASFVKDDACIVEHEKLISHRIQPYLLSNDGQDYLAKSLKALESNTLCSDDSYDEAGKVVVKMITYIPL